MNNNKLQEHSYRAEHSRNGNDPNQKKDEEERGSSTAEPSRYTPDAGVNGVAENQIVNDEEQVLPVNPTEQIS